MWKKSLIYILTVVILMGLVLGNSGCNTQQKEDNVYQLNDWDFTISQLSGTDALGRKVNPTNGNQTGKYVSIYFFPWFGTHTKKIYNIDELLTKYENGIRGNLENPLWAISGEYYNSTLSPNGEFHYWGEPIYGYYDSSDPWVIRKQLELLAYAQVDCLMLDYTNNVTYLQATTALLDAIKEMSETGCKVPKVAFMLSAVNDEHLNDSLQAVYNDYLSVEKYKNCFFIGDSKINPSGKPLVTGKDAIKDEFLEKQIWFKTLQWHGVPFDPNNFPAMSEEVVQLNHNGFMSVTTEVYSSANDVHEISWCTDPYLYPEMDLLRGRGWEPGDKTNGTNPDKVAAGACFNNQWKNVFENPDIFFVQVQTWNEWWAQKQNALMKPYHDVQRAVFVDTFNEAFSRDIEPVKGRLGDNYYLQLVQNIRKFKQKSVASAVKHEKQTVQIEKGLLAWKDIPGNYLDLEGEAIIRDYPSIDPKLFYKNNSARNDIVRLKFANDSENLYVMVETKQTITKWKDNDQNWMNLYISTGKNSGWEGYDFIINRFPQKDGLTSVEFINTDGEFLRKGDVHYYLEDNRIFYSIPLKVIGVSENDQIEIKASDNLLKSLEVSEFYTNGDCVPVGRLNFAYLIA